jgi:hypothetical protein
LCLHIDPLASLIHIVDERGAVGDLIGSVDVDAVKERAMEVGSKLTGMVKDFMEEWGGY